MTAEMTCNAIGCQVPTNCGHTLCGDLCPAHLAEYLADIEAETAAMRCKCGACGGFIGDPTDYPEWNADRHAEAIERNRVDAEAEASARGFRDLMRAAQHGAPEAYRFR